MSYLTTVKYMCFLDANQLLAVDTTNSWTTSNMNVVTGQGTEMLDDDDATSLFKATTTAVDATIEVEFQVSGTPVSRSISAFGLCNHNLRTAGVQHIYLEWWSGAWENVDDPGEAAYTLPTGYTDRDLILLFTTRSTTKVRLRLAQSATLPIYIGYMYWGSYYQFNRNPGTFVQTRTPATRYLQSAGGMSHAIKGMRYRPGELEMNFYRAKATDLIHIQSLGLTDNIIGVLPPEYAPKPYNAPRGNDNFFGRFQEITMDPKTPSNITQTNEVYDMMISMKGAL